MHKNTVSQPASAGQQGVVLSSGENFVEQPVNGQIAQLSAQPADNVAALKFLNFIFDRITGGFVEFRYFTAGRNPKVCGRSTYLPLPLNEERIVQEVLARNGRQMITFGPGLRFHIPSSGEGKDRDVLQVGCIWAELDYKVAKGGAIEIFERVQNFPLRPSVVVNSGYGRHAYFVFHTPFSDRDGSLVVWNKLIVGLKMALQSDAVQNLSRVMRLPGTLNIKEATPVPCEISEDLSAWVRYSVEEVEEAIGEVLSNPMPQNDHERIRSMWRGEPAEESVAVATSPDLTRLRQRGVYDDVIKAIVTGQRTIRTGVHAGRSDDESGRDFWIATTLFEKGFDEAEIASIFRAYPQGCGSKMAQPRHGDRYLKLTIDKAKKRVEEKRALGIDTEGNDNQEEALGLPANALPPCYSYGGNSSIWFCPPLEEGENGKPPKPVKVTDSPLYIAEIQENIDNGQISVTIGYRYIQRPHTTTILRSQMSDSRQLVSALSGEGAPINSNNARLVISYLAAYENAFASSLPHKKVTGRFGRGRTEGPIFLPGILSNIEFMPSGPGDSALYRAFSSRRGSLHAWVELMQAISSDNLMIPQVAVLTALVPPLLGKLQIPNFILDIYGNTTTGKSTSLKLAASVYGNPNDKHPDSLILQWTNTKVAIEQIASMCGDLPVFLDDAQHTSDDLKKTVIYMVANGRGKGRGARGGGIRETPTWRTVALSTSEEPLHESSPHEGARGRLLPVGGLTPPFRTDSGSFVQSLEHAVILNHGHAGEAYIRHLNGLTNKEWSELQRRYASIRTWMVKNASSDIVGRVSAYIAAIQLAAEIASPLLGLPFKPDVVGAWLTLHLDEQQRDQNMVLHAIRILADHYISNTMLFARDEQQDSPYVGVGGGQSRDLQGAVKRGEYVAFTRSAIENVFQKRKWNATAILNKLAEAGLIIATEKDRHTKKVSVDGVKHRMICIKWIAMFPEDAHGDMSEARAAHLGR